MLQWIYWVIAGAFLNVAVNAGYKTLSAKSGIFLVTAGVYAVASAALFFYGLSTKNGKVSDLASGYTPAIIFVMGIAWAAVMICFIISVSKGPFSIVNPLWACLSALVSVAIGMMLLREAPSVTALAGVGLYIAGAFLMARG